MSDRPNNAPAARPVADRPGGAGNREYIAPTPAPAADKPRLLEVELKHKYCPHFLVADDGSVEPNEDTSEIRSADGSLTKNPGGHLKYIMPGVVKLHGKDVAIVLRSGIGVPTLNTEF